MTDLEQAAAPEDKEARGASATAEAGQSIWKQLESADGLEQLLPPWLAIQSELIGTVREALAAFDLAGDGSFSLQVAWPRPKSDSQRLLQTALRARTENRGIVQQWGEDDAAETALAYPVTLDDNRSGVVAVLLTGNGQPLSRAMRQLQWGTARLREQALREQRANAERLAGRSSHALNLLAAALQHERFDAMCHACTTELAMLADCERVSLGFVHGNHGKLQSVSHSAQFGQRMNLNRLLENAIDEAIGQHSILLYPPSGSGPSLTLQAHAELSAGFGNVRLLTVPLLAREKPVGALVFERPANRPFDQDSIDIVAACAALLGPVLTEKQQNDRWLLVKALDALRRQLRHLFGPRHTLKKLLVGATLGFFALSLLLTGPYRVTAQSTTEGSEQRAVIAAFDGYIREAPVRAGDRVEAGQLMASIDDREIALERLRLLAEKQEKQFARERALSERKLAEVNIISAQIDKVDAQLQQTDELLARARISAPFAGLVVSGDLQQSIGAAVRRGDVLFEITPQDEYRVVLQVPDSQIADVAAGQPGRLLNSALPDRPLDIVIERITPVAETRDGRNTFRVEASLVSSTAGLRPGMEGVAKIEAGERRLLWIWTRPLLERARIAIWRWLQ
ncbi:MAG: HlyD family efflux transporter periplasmic adaptor subunit [Oceanospirillaceae bacterium]|nr:HlyD family efflux transporter periplasmic adaptor subunit [Oceanospirillaceae bacterium]